MMTFRGPVGTAMNRRDVASFLVTCGLSYWANRRVERSEAIVKVVSGPRQEYERTAANDPKAMIT